MNISQYLIENNLAYTWLNPKVFNIGDNNYCVIEAKDDRILDETFDLILDDQDAELIQQFSCNYLVFELGEWIFYTDTEKTKLNPLKYIHKAFKSTPYTHLGVHGMYEICNGSRNYKDWCKKAKFLGATTLGICEYNTLAGTLQFQLDCKDAGIKSILGITALVKNSTNQTYKVKLFAKNEQGWSNILKVGKAINVDNGGFVAEEQLKPLLQGNIIVFQTFDKSVNSFVSNDFEYYFQIDPVQWKSDDRDREHLENLKSIVDLGLPTIILCDSYYLDKQDARIKETLNKIGKINRDYLSTDQWFKTKEEIEESLIELFENKEKGIEFIDRAFDNADRLGNECDFKIDLSSFHLPQYTLNKVEDLLNADKYELFWNLIDNGLRNKVVNKNLDQNIYYERIQTEFEIIDKGGFVDYFLMLADIVKFCEDNRILVGAGRGSAAGSLIAYLLNITKIDPLEYGLIFERFLNPSRIKSSLPDIDTDIASDRREEVIKYIKERYGSDNVCSIGSYGQLKIKSAIQDLGRLSSIPPQTVNFYTAMMDKAGDEFDYIFETASSNPKFKEFIQENYDLVNELPLVIGNFRNTSIHASGIIVTPKNHNGKDMTVYEWMPVKKVDGELISEWDGVLLDKAGFLKADILGLKELDKFSDILSLIKKNAKDAPNIYELAPNDKNVYQLFKDGLTQDAFQFGTDGLIQYCTEVKPTSLGELAAINSLYRPGPMGSNAHNDYVKIKMGRKEPHYDWGCEDITKSTYSLIVYQEQIIKICQIVAGFSLSEADEIRKATGKKLLDKMVSYKKLFIEGAVKKGCPQEEAKNIWNKIEIFAQYSFNKCISGDEKFYKVGHQKNGQTSWQPTIGEMYKIKNDSVYAKKTGHEQLGQKYRNLGYGSSFSLDNRNRLIRNKIKDIRFEGIRDIYRIILEDGKKIDITLNHKFPTSNGLKKVSELLIGESLIVNDGYKQDPCSYIWNLGTLPNYPVKGQSGFQKRDTPYTKFLSIRKSLLAEHNCCQWCGKKHKRLEVHHLDGDHGNSDKENMAILCPSCHKKDEYKLGRLSMGMKGLYTSFKKITSIDFLKTDEVYDVEMEAPYHTFATKEGVVTCNSHAVTYSYMGYIGQYLKYYFPIEFWTVSLQKAKEEEVPKRISEINRSQSIKILSPDINKSEDKFISDFETNSIYWSIGKIRNVGEVALKTIIEERSKNGKFFSMQEFISRVDKRKVNKTCITNLILSGCFDIVEGIKTINDRYKLLIKFFEYIKEDVPEGYSNKPDWFWFLEQKRVSGSGLYDYEKLLPSLKTIEEPERYYLTFDKIDLQDNLDCEVLVIGVLTEIIERKSKKGMFAQLTVDQNNAICSVNIWNESWEIYKDMLLESENKIVALQGKIVFDNWKKKQCVHSISTTKIETIGIN